MIHCQMLHGLVGTDIALIVKRKQWFSDAHVVCHHQFLFVIGLVSRFALGV
jgi:hypothetical protein